MSRAAVAKEWEEARDALERKALEAHPELDELRRTANLQVMRYKEKLRNRSAQSRVQVSSNVVSLSAYRYAKSVGVVPDAEQKRVLTWFGRRLLLNCTRQWGKSTTIALRSAFRAAYYPYSLILCVAPGLRQSSLLAAKIKGFLDLAPDGPKRLDDNATSCKLANGSMVVALPGDPHTVRGFSAPDAVNIDEGAFVLDPLFAAVVPMLIVSSGELVVLSTPNGKRGYYYEQWENGGDDWDRIAVPASKCPRINPAELERERRTLPHWIYRQEYCCEFVETLDAVFRSDDIARAQVTPEKQRIARPAAPWETAA